MLNIDKLDKNRMPKHVAIIMDGNGRWAKKRGLDRSEGHRKGVETVHIITKAATELGLSYLTLYTFSIENWNRPKEEVEALMDLLVWAIEQETPTMMENNIRLMCIGDEGMLPEAPKKRLNKCIEQTSGNTGMALVLALSYSSKSEIVNATKQLAKKVSTGSLSIDDITEQTIADHLTTKGIPDPDLLIRTGGELRISNFLLWQLSYAELYFTETYWPDFDKDNFVNALLDYQTRERRFGKTSEQL